MDPAHVVSCGVIIIIIIIPSIHFLSPLRVVLGPGAYLSCLSAKAG